MTEMNTAWTAASEEIYKAQAAAGEQPGADAGAQANAGGQQAAGETVTDAEFEEVK
jgi:molecular chaperone DnaK